MITALYIRWRLFAALFFASLSTYSQSRRPIVYFLEAGQYAAPVGDVSFWHRANRYGIVPRGEYVSTLRGGLRVEYFRHQNRQSKRFIDSLRAANRRIDWGWGIEAVANGTRLGQHLDVLLPEVYLKARHRQIEFWVGRRREVIGLADSLLSSGSFAWSGNALPPVKIQLNTVGWLPIGKSLAINGLFAHGWFERDRFIQNSFLHQKALYVRLGKPTWPVLFTAGFNHQAQWGGRNSTLSSEFIKNEQLPSSLRDYVYVVTGTTLAGKQIDTTTYSKFDAGNRIGNHLGTLDVGMQLRTRLVDIYFYRQSIYEDGSLFYLINIGDGLNGLRFVDKRPYTSGLRVSNVLLEYLDSYSQGGDNFVDGDPFGRGRDNYFNHGQYRDGWSLFGRTIGTPFITPAGDLPGNFPTAQFTNNNRVRVYHVGLAGQVSTQINFVSKFSLSKNAGTYNTPFSPIAKQFSGYVGVVSSLNKEHTTFLTTSAAYDRGDLYPNNLSFYVSVRKRGLLQSKYVR